MDGTLASRVRLAELFARRFSIGIRRAARRRVVASPLGRALLAHLPDDARRLISRWRADRSGWPVLFSTGAPDALAAELRRRFPHRVAAQLAAGEQVLRRAPEVLGTVVQAEAGRLPWHVDPESRYAWPKDRPGTSLKPVEGAEIKRPWELSRFSHLLPAATAYFFSGEDRFASEAAAQLEDWLAQNPLGLGVNWAVPMEAGLRAVAWLYLLDRLWPAPALTPQLRTRVLESLFQHGRFLRALPEQSALLAGNHLVVSWAALLVLGTVFGQTEEGRGWLAAGLKGLAQEARDQFDADGLYRGGSLHYHALMAEAYAASLLLAKRNGVFVPQELVAATQRMVEAVRWCTPPHGGLPRVGDADDGRFLPLDPSVPRDDRRFLAALAAALQGEAEGSPEEAGEAVLWGVGLSPPRGARAAREGRAFPGTGLYVLRSEDLHVLVDGYQTFARAPNGHRHQSRLALVVSDALGPLLVDPGVACYTQDPATCAAFRSAAYHNVLLLDGAPQNVGGGAFRIGREFPVRFEAAELSGDRQSVRLGFEGYRRLSPPADWSRTVTLDAVRRVVLVRDEVSGALGRQVETRWHFAAGALEPGAAAHRWVDPQGRLRAFWMALDGHGGDAAIEAGQVAPGYGRAVEAPVLVRRLRAGAARLTLTSALVCDPSATPDEARRRAVLALEAAP